jgi:hypothetical protein
MGFRSIPKGVQNYAGLNARELLIGIDFENLIHVFCKIQDDGDVAALSRQACACSTGENRRPKFLTRCYRADDILVIAWHDQADGDLAVIRSVGGVEGTTAPIESHFPSHHTFQFELQF